MKSLKNYIKYDKSSFISLSEKLLINKNYKDISYDFNDVDELYLIRFRNDKSQNYIHIDILDINKITMKDNDNCTVDGELILSNAHYLDCEFKYDSKNGILYRIDSLFKKHYDILMHSALKENFKKFVQNCIDDPDKKYFPDEVFNILNIECPKFDDKFNIEYDCVAHADNIIYMKKLAELLNMK